MNKLGISWAYWSDDWDDDFLPLIPRAKALGFDILEVGSGMVVDMDAAQRGRVKEEIAKARMELTFCIGLPPQCDVASEDAAVRRQGIACLEETARMIQDMGTGSLGGVIYGTWLGKMPDGVSDRCPAVDRSIESLKEVMKTVEDCGVEFLAEPVNRFEQFIMNTAAEAVEYVDRVGSPHLKILLDTFHMNIEEDGIRESILTAGDKLAHLHLGEPNRRAPGRGRFPWDEFCDALKEIGYDGSMSMEPFLRTAGQIGRDIAVYRDLSEGVDLDEEAGRAVRFLREKLGS